MIKNKFTFAVLTFNHELYIIEHLESIRFLIENYGAAYDFNLIVADDGSRDRTIDLVERWLLVYGGLFSEIKILGDGTNNGTCFNYTRIWPLVEGDLFKITAGDDVYSYVNIFSEAERLAVNDFFSGTPLLLIDEKIIRSRSTAFHILASDVIYEKRPFMDRLKNISSINTPNLFCGKKFLLNDELSRFINGYSVTEDFPMLVEVSRLYEDVSFHQSGEVYVYYRRTSGSTYLVRGSDFDKDKIKIFNYMISLEDRRTGRLLLKNRLYCYGMSSRVMKLLLNFNYYIYAFRVLFRVVPIFKRYFKFHPDMSRHKQHYDFINSRAKAFHGG